jgi:hypothetical protein
MRATKPKKSARGLFRATGKTAKPVLIRNLLDSTFQLVETLAPEANDFYATPPEPPRALLSAEGSRLAQFPLLWEPCAGDGAMVREMRNAGHIVHASDLIDRGCGAEIKSIYHYTAESVPSRRIMTNPPFTDCQPDNGFVRFALEVLGCDYLALLLPLGWPGAMERAALWAEHPPARVYLMRWRIDFTKQGAPPMLNAWFVWDGKTRDGDTRYLMLDRKDVRQTELFAGLA